MSDTAKKSAQKGGYTAENITWLEGLEAVRHRPGMYIGDVGRLGLFVLCREVLDNATDEAMGGHANDIVVRLLSDNVVSIEDNGRGIPVDIHPKTGKSALELVMTELHAGGKFDEGNYKVAAGLHGVGVSVVNALSTFVEVEVKRDGKLYQQRYEKGIPQYDVKVIGRAEGTGTKVTYQADTSIFTTDELDVDLITKRLRELSYLIPQCKYTLENHRVEPATIEVYQNKGGLAAFCEHLNKNKTPLHRHAVHFTRQNERVEVEVAIQYNEGYHDTIVAFGNTIHNIHGGLHESGFKTGLTRAINSYARKKGQLKEKDANLTGEDVREGLSAVISVKVPNAMFSSQAKERLTGPQFVEGAVNSIVGEGLAEYLDENPNTATRIIQKCITAAQAREAAKKAADLIKRKNALESDSLPGKLADCAEKDPRECEIFLVEGDSAGGSAKQGRDRRFQAILPLRGKIINVEKNRLDKILANEEIRAMITAFGTGIAERVDYSDIADDIAEMEQGKLDLEAMTSTSLEDGDGLNGHNNGANGNGANGNGANGNGVYKRSARGGKVGSEFDIQRLRYHRIIIMCDADVDGSHIRTLLLTFLFRYMRPLVESGHVYIAKPPLYSVRKGKQLFYAYNDRERDKILQQSRGEVGRYKGLGEMNPEELWSTTMEPDKRLLMQVGLEDAAEADQIFSILMGDAVEPRKEFIEKNAKLLDAATDLDI
ncbi:MAG: type IIA DNA topoisomerase subunit B [Abitibacteriaceae bacterium]|nr:type IIA DNA topoisomerase subunit B [Abditibacteriaceae bacterium]